MFNYFKKIFSVFFISCILSSTCAMDRPAREAENTRKNSDRYNQRIYEIYIAKNTQQSKKIFGYIISNPNQPPEKNCTIQ